MKLSYLVIGDEDTVLGFRSAGVPGVVAGSSQDVVEALQFAQEKNVGVIILTEEVAGMAQAELDEIRFEQELPMTVLIPGPGGPLAGRRTLSEIIREAIGVKV